MEIFIVIVGILYVGTMLYTIWGIHDNLEDILKLSYKKDVDEDRGE